MSLRIAVAPPLAAQPLALLHRACFPEDPWDAEAMDRILMLPGAFAYVAWQADDLTGFLLARDLGDEIEVLSLGVLLASRRRGIARGLLETVIGETARRQIGSIVLEVASDNEPARRLYGGLGFAQVGHRPRYYRRRDGVFDALILRRGVASEPPQN